MGSSAPRLVLAALLIAGALAAHAQQRPSQPEPASGWTPKQLATAKKHIVAAAHPLAVDAGLAMLERGGSAIDAALAVQLVLNVVEPNASGIGGGAYLLYYDAKSRKIHALDGRETAPSGATPTLFVGSDGKPLPFRAARVGGRSVGVPGVPRLMEAAHARYGRLPWKSLFVPAIAIAQDGFPMSRRLVKVMADDTALLEDSSARAIFFNDDDRVKPVGALVRNPALARTLRTIAEDGVDAFYIGDVGRDVVATVRGHRNAGSLSLEDLAGYRVRTVQPVCGKYRRWTLCGMPPSSSGGIAVLQMMGMLERFDMARVRPNSPEAVHLLSEAGRLAFADRGKYVGDDRFTHVPAQGLVDPAYVAQRSSLIRAERSMRVAAPGIPAGARIAYAHDGHLESVGTSHIAVVDAQGNAVAMSTTIESNNGSAVMVRGFLLNNELTDFSFPLADADSPLANGISPGKRPRSSMAPFLVLDERGALHMVVGSAGGSHIIGHVAKTLVATLDWGMDVQSAIELPNFGSRNGPTEIEKGTPLEALEASLRAMAHDVRVIDMTSGIHAIRRTRAGWEGGADPRREGVARGR